MKNCPWFSLRSNSIESRFRSIRGAIFLVHAYVKLNKKKQSQKRLWIRFAHVFIRFARQKFNLSSIALLGFPL